MLKIDKIKEIGKKLPRGAKSRISKESGVSRSLITQFFKGTKKPSIEITTKILISTNKILKEIDNKEKAIISMIDNIKL